MLAVALATAVPAGADLSPIRRSFGETQLPRVRAGTVLVPAGHSRGRIRVIVRLAQPPLAQYAATTTFAAGGARQRLSVASARSRTYLARLADAQQVAIAQLRRAIPEARVGRRFGIVLDGITVDLPATRLPDLVRQGFATKIYPSLRYTLKLNDSPGLIAAPALAAATGARGDGVKIAVVDDGIDQTGAFFSPSGFTYPAGFPKGLTRWTTPKVIVAKVFPGPGSGETGTLAVDPDASFHGTHVAGIAAGNAGTVAPAGPDHPTVTGLSGVAPRAWVGNYRVFTVPTPLGHVANTPEIVAAFEAAVADGMDVINFSGGGPETEPANDALIETIRNVVAAGVVPVISAGNDRDEFGLGSAGSPGTAPDSISVAAVSNDQVFSPTLSVVAAGAPASIARLPFRPAPVTPVPTAWTNVDQALVDVGSITGTNGAPVNRFLCAPSGDPNGAGNPLPRGSLAGAIALVSRGVCTFVSKAERAKAAGATGIVLVDNRSGEANFVPVQLDLPGGMIADLDGQRVRSLMATTGGRTLIRVRTAYDRIVTGRGGVVTSFSSAGPTAFGHDLKPDVAAPGGQILSPRSRSRADPFAVFDGTSMAAPHVTGAAALLVQRHPTWTPRQVKSALMSHRRAGLGRHGAEQRGLRPPRGRRARQRPPRRRPEDLHRAGVALVRRPEGERRRAEPVAAAPDHRRRRRLGPVAGRAATAVGEPGRDPPAPGHRRPPAGRPASALGDRLGSRCGHRRRRLRLHRPPPGKRDEADPVLLRGDAARAARRSSRSGSSVSRPATPRRAARVSASTVPRPLPSARRRTTPALRCARTEPRSCTRSRSRAPSRTSASP